MWIQVQKNRSDGWAESKEPLRRQYIKCGYSDKEGLGGRSCGKACDHIMLLGTVYNIKHKSYF